MVDIFIKSTCSC